MVPENLAGEFRTTVTIMHFMRWGLFHFTPCIVSLGMSRLVSSRHAHYTQHYSQEGSSHAACRYQCSSNLFLLHGNLSITLCHRISTFLSESSQNSIE